MSSIQELKFTSAVAVLCAQGLHQVLGWGSEAQRGLLGLGLFFWSKSLRGCCAKQGGCSEPPLFVRQAMFLSSASYFFFEFSPQHFSQIAASHALPRARRKLAQSLPGDRMSHPPIHAITKQSSRAFTCGPTLVLSVPEKSFITCV